MERIIKIMRAALADARDSVERACIQRGIDALDAELAMMPTAKLPVAQKEQVAA